MVISIDPNRHNYVDLQPSGGLHTLLELEPIGAPLLRAIKVENHGEEVGGLYPKIAHDPANPSPRYIWAPLLYPLSPGNPYGTFDARVFGGSLPEMPPGVTIPYLNSCRWIKEASLNPSGDPVDHQLPALSQSNIDLSRVAIINAGRTAPSTSENPTLPVLLLFADNHPDDNDAPYSTVQCYIYKSTDMGRSWELAITWTKDMGWRYRGSSNAFFNTPVRWDKDNPFFSIPYFAIGDGRIGLHASWTPPPLDVNYNPIQGGTIPSNSPVVLSSFDERTLIGERGLAYGTKSFYLWQTRETGMATKVDDQSGQIEWSTMNPNGTGRMAYNIYTRKSTLCCLVEGKKQDMHARVVDSFYIGGPVHDAHVYKVGNWTRSGRTGYGAIAGGQFVNNWPVINTMPREDSGIGEPDSDDTLWYQQRMDKKAFILAHREYVKTSTEFGPQTIGGMHAPFTSEGGYRKAAKYGVLCNKQPYDWYGPETRGGMGGGTYYSPHGAYFNNAWNGPISEADWMWWSLNLSGEVVPYRVWDKVRNRIDLMGLEGWERARVLYYHDIYTIMHGSFGPFSYDYWEHNFAPGHTKIRHGWYQPGQSYSYLGPNFRWGSGMTLGAEHVVFVERMGKTLSENAVVNTRVGTMPIHEAAVKAFTEQWGGIDKSRGQRYNEDGDLEPLVKSYTSPNLDWYWNIYYPATCGIEFRIHGTCPTDGATELHPTNRTRFEIANPVIPHEPAAYYEHWTAGSFNLPIVDVGFEREVFTPICTVSRGKVWGTLPVEETVDGTLTWVTKWAYTQSYGNTVTTISTPDEDFRPTDLQKARQLEHPEFRAFCPLGRDHNGKDVILWRKTPSDPRNWWITRDLGATWEAAVQSHAGLPTFSRESAIDNILDLGQDIGVHVMGPGHFIVSGRSSISWRTVTRELDVRGTYAFINRRGGSDFGEGAISEMLETTGLIPQLNPETGQMEVVETEIDPASFKFDFNEISWKFDSIPPSETIRFKYITGVAGGVNRWGFYHVYDFGNLGSFIGYANPISILDADVELELMKNHAFMMRVPDGVLTDVYPNEAAEALDGVPWFRNASARTEHTQPYD